MEARTLTVSRTGRLRETRPRLVLTPMIRIRGQYLERAGFTEGTKYTVTVHYGRITLDLIEPSHE